MATLKEFFVFEDLTIDVQTKDGDAVSIDQKSSSEEIDSGFSSPVIGMSDDPTANGEMPMAAPPDDVVPPALPESVKRLAEMVCHLNEDETGRRYDASDIAQHGYDMGILGQDPSGISGDWSWEDLQAERPELAASFQETGADPSSGDFTGADNKVYFVPKEEGQPAFRYLGKDQGWIEMGDEEWAEVAAAGEQKSGREAEIDAMPTKFDPSFIGQEDDPNAGFNFGDVDDDDFDPSQFIDADDAGAEEKSSAKSSEKSSSMLPPEKASKASKKGSGRAPAVGSPEWDEFLKSIE